MASNTFMKVDEVAEMLGISKSYAESNKGRCWRSVRKGCDLK